MRVVLIAALCAIAAPAMAQEKLSLSNVDVRTALTFKASDAAVQRMLPEGWDVNSPTAGPSQGFNLGMTLIDQKYTQDAEGKPTAPVRGVVLTIPAKKKGSDTAGTMVVAGLFALNGVPGAYGVYSPARVLIERRTRTRLNGGETLVNEFVGFQDRGRQRDRSSSSLYAGGSEQGQSRGQGLFRCQARFLPHLPYRAGGRCGPQRPGQCRSRDQSLDQHPGKKFAPLFDGTEKVISMTSIPWYSRQVYLP